MASGLGILASMLAGGGKGVQDNAQRSMDEKAKLAEERRKETGILARMQEQRTYDENKYKQQLADQERIESERYQRDKADKLAADEANRAHEINLASIRGGNSKEDAIKLARAQSFDKQEKEYSQLFNDIDLAIRSTTKTSEREALLKRKTQIAREYDTFVKSNADLEGYSSLYPTAYQKSNYLLEALMPKNKTVNAGSSPSFKEPNVNTNTSVDDAGFLDNIRTSPDPQLYDPTRQSSLTPYNAATHQNLQPSPYALHK